MALNIITAKFCSGATQAWASDAWQYDYGQVLKFDGVDLPEAYQVHFSNEPMTGETITQIGNSDGVSVPDQFFQSGETIYAWVYLHDGEDDGETVYMVTIPVKKRPQPSDEVPTPVEQSAIDQAIAALNIAVEKADEAITHYPTIIDGTWHVWDVTSEAYVDTGVEARGEKGEKGNKGDNGISPTITVTDITNGHRVTITDADGTKTFDVMNGAQGDPGAKGDPGADGVSPTVTVTEITGGHRVVITDASGEHTFDVMNGEGGSTITVDSAMSSTSENPVQNKVINAELTDVKEDLSQSGINISYLQDELYSYTEQTNKRNANNVAINAETGLYIVDTKYRTLMFSVTPGQFIKVVSNYNIQFQTDNTSPTSGTSVRVGETYSAGTHYLTVPQDATFVAVSFIKAEGDPVMSLVTRKFTETVDRLLSDEELVLTLGQKKDSIREIDLTSYLFDTQKKAQIARVDPNTMASKLDGLNIPGNYAAVRIGLQVLYLPKGTKIITNIDSFYDGTTFPTGTFNLGTLRGVILANIINNGDTVTGTVAWGREKFDGRFREIEIGYTAYYCLFYRADVDYTNKCYIYYPEEREISTDDVRVTDITDDVRMSDGYLQYNGTGSWHDNVVDGVNGGAGRYYIKTAMLHLTGNEGKSLFVDGMNFYTTFDAYQPVIHFADNGDGTYTPTPDGLIFPEFTVAKHNYITVPLTDEDHIRVQFVATASPAYVRFLIVPNELLFEKDLANPVFYGKKILGYGDSYIAGQGVNNTWHYRLAQENYGRYVNKGYAGAGLCFGGGGSLITDRITALDEDADIYFLCFGRNDNSTNIKIGNNDDELDTSVEWTSTYLINTATFKGAMNYLFNYLETRHPFAKIVTITPWGFENNAGVTSGLSCLDYIDAMQEMSKKWGITCFNAAGDVGIHVRIEEFRTRYFLASDDQSHLNNDGHALMAERAGKLLTNLMYDD